MPSRAMDASEAVVLVPGLWMPGASLSLLARRLSRCGYRCRVWTYSSTLRSPEQNARRLAEQVRALSAARVHFVGHSLGGLLIRQLFHDFPDQRPGRVVTLGSPHAGSAVAERLIRDRRWLAWAFGRSVPGLTGAVPPWEAAQPMGVIAGNRNVGLGCLFAPLPRPHDGTVAVAETRHAGASEHLVLPVSHFSMLWSREVARQTCAFLRHGRFESGHAAARTGESGVMRRAGEQEQRRRDRGITDSD